VVFCYFDLPARKSEIVIVMMASQLDIVLLIHTGEKYSKNTANTFRQNWQKIIRTCINT